MRDNPVSDSFQNLPGSTQVHTRYFTGLFIDDLVGLHQHCKGKLLIVSSEEEKQIYRFEYSYVAFLMHICIWQTHLLMLECHLFKGHKVTGACQPKFHGKRRMQHQGQVEVRHHDQSESTRALDGSQTDISRSRVMSEPEKAERSQQHKKVLLTSISFTCHILCSPIRQFSPAIFWWTAIWCSHRQCRAQSCSGLHDVRTLDQWSMRMKKLQETVQLQLEKQRIQ